LTGKCVTYTLRIVTEISPFGIRRAAFIHATPEHIWEEFTTHERMKAWFGTGHTLTQYEPRVGGMVETSFGDEPHYARGEVLVYEPGRELTFEQCWLGPDWTGHEWSGPVKVTILLTPAGSGTMVELFHHGYDLIGGDPAEYLSAFEGGWDTHHLDALAAIVAA
jgi:uncharacterized protein YndB with AHSA1/START domain